MEKGGGGGREEGGAMVLGKLSVPWRPTNLDIVGQGPAVLKKGADVSCLDIFLSSFSLSL